MRRVLSVLSLFLLSATSLAAQSQKVADKKFWLVTIAAYASAIADEEVTQYMLRKHPGQFKEANWLLGNSRKQAYPVLMGLTTASVVGGYFKKKDGSDYWWVPAAVSVGVHSFAIGYNIRLGGKQ